MSLYGSHLHVEEQPPHCATCTRIATVEVFDVAERSCGYFCMRCGRAKVKRLEHLEMLFMTKGDE